jgi:WD40 repeat protein
VAFSPDGRWLATAGGGSVGDVKIWDVKTGDEVAAWEAHAGRTTAVAFSPDSKNLATGGGIWNGPGEFAVWDVTKQIRTGSFQIAEGGVLSLAYSPDGQTLAIGAGYVVGDTAKGAVRLWDITKGTESTTTLQGPPAEMTSLVYSHGGKSLIASTFHSDPQANQTLWEMKVWNAKTGRAQSVLDSNREQPLEAAFFNLRTLAVSDDGNIIAGAGRNGVNGLVKAWNVTTGTMSRPSEARGSSLGRRCHWRWKDCGNRRQRRRHDPILGCRRPERAPGPRGIFRSHVRAGIFARRQAPGRRRR